MPRYSLYAIIDDTMIDSVSGFWQELHDYNKYSMLMLIQCYLDFTTKQIWLYHFKFLALLILPLFSIKQINRKPRCWITKYRGYWWKTKYFIMHVKWISREYYNCSNIETHCYQTLPLSAIYQRMCQYREACRGYGDNFTVIMELCPLWYMKDNFQGANKTKSLPLYVQVWLHAINHWCSRYFNWELSHLSSIAVRPFGLHRNIDIKNGKT